MSHAEYHSKLRKAINALVAEHNTYMMSSPDIKELRSLVGKDRIFGRIESGLDHYIHEMIRRRNTVIPSRDIKIVLDMIKKYPNHIRSKIDKLLHGPITIGTTNEISKLVIMNHAPTMSQTRTATAVVNLLYDILFSVGGAHIPNYSLAKIYDILGINPPDVNNTVPNPLLDTYMITIDKAFTWFITTIAVLVWDIVCVYSQYMGTTSDQQMVDDIAMNPNESDIIHTYLRLVRYIDQIPSASSMPT